MIRIIQEFQNNFEKGKSFDFASPDASYEYYDDHGHGTHTAGTVLGESVGVAPGAKLLAAKVCDAYGRCSTSGMYASIDWGITEGVDVISVSIGGPSGGDEEKMAYEKVESAGIVVVAAAGNSGTNYVDYPGRLSTVLAVGAVDEQLSRADFSQYGPDLALVGPGVSIKSSLPGMGVTAEVKIDVGGQGFESIEHRVGIGSGTSEKGLNASLTYIGLGSTEDISELDLTGQIALVARGELTFTDKVTNAISKGAVGVIIHNNAEGLIDPFISSESVEIPVIFIDKGMGESLQQTLTTGTVVKASILTSLIPSYQFMDGTSMSCPHVSGVAALVKSANTELNQVEIRDVILNTATDLSDVDQFGTGLVNAETAVEEAIKRATPSVVLPIAN